MGAGDYCLQLAAGTCSEQVTIQGKTFASTADRIIISSDVGAPVTINPPAASMAAFHVLNDSVTIMGITIRPYASIPYGILASSSSSNVLISSVSVDGNNLITTAGILISTQGAVGYSSVTVQGAAKASSWPGPFRLGRPELRCRRRGRPHDQRLGGIGHRHGNSFLRATTGVGAVLASGANNNRISFSTITSDGGIGLQLTSASSNTFNGDYIQGVRGR